MRTGRPRSFCKEEALDKAMTVFWRQGYEGASMADLTKAMGINPPSLYACFGSKEGLFKAVLERYDGRRKDLMDKVLLVLSEHSILSEWVEDEVDQAFEEEQKRGKVVLFPVRLDDEVLTTDKALVASMQLWRRGI